MSRGIAKVADLKARSRIDPLDRDPYTPCWHWLGGKTTDGTPRIHCFDHDRGEKRTMTGPRAVWNIAKGTGPGRQLVYRCCFQMDCVQPEHLRLAASRAEIGAAMRAVGNRKGTHVEARRRNILRAIEAHGVKPTPEEIVLACRAAPRAVSNVELARVHGIAHTTVSRIRRGETRRGVAA